MQLSTQSSVENNKNNPLIRLKRLPFVKATERFFYSPLYFIFMLVITSLANIFALEIPMYVICVLIGIYLSLLGRDLLPFVPIVVCCYITPSVNNNPGRNEDSVFSGWSLIFILVISALLLASIIIRICTDDKIGKKGFFTRKRELLTGILILGVGYFLSGAFNGKFSQFGFKNLYFAFLQFIAVFLFYFLFTGAVDWEKAPKNYLAWTGLTVGFILIIEMLNIYFTQDVVIGGVVHRENFYTGWGHYNNIGALLSMMIPFAFQLACKSKKNSWIYYICGAIFLVGVIFTYSRTSIVFAFVAYIASGVVVLFKSRNRRMGLFVNIITFSAIVVIFILFHEQLTKLFDGLFNNPYSMFDRAKGYKAGIKQFLKYPVFGGGFFPTDTNIYQWSTTDFSVLYPPRWHNTAVQLLASCGIIGTAAYVYHRYTTIKLILKKPTVEVIYIGISISTLLLLSLLDCHFFNVGPTLFYSTALAFAEKQKLKVKAE